MRILTNTTSPYARIARIALAEKGFDLDDTRIVDPWGDDTEMLKLNPASRVPTLELDSGLPLTESLLILLWLERKVPEPSLLGADPDRVVSNAGLAMGVIDAMTSIVTGLKQIDPGFADSRVGLKRRRTIVAGFRAMETDPPAYASGAPDVAVITAVVAVDYARLRFADALWLRAVTRLAALRDTLAARPSFASTPPHL